MIVLKSTYDSLKRRCEKAENDAYIISLKMIQWKQSYDELLGKWNELVEKINVKGGQEFLDSSPQLSQEEIKKLLQLCHPDKHDGKEMAVTMTAKLLKMRKQ